MIDSPNPISYASPQNVPAYRGLLIAAFILRVLAMLGYLLGGLWAGLTLAAYGIPLTSITSSVNVRQAMLLAVLVWIQPLGVVAAGALLHTVGEGALALRDMARNSFTT